MDKKKQKSKNNLNVRGCLLVCMCVRAHAFTLNCMSVYFYTAVCLYEVLCARRYKNYVSRKKNHIDDI